MADRVLVLQPGVRPVPLEVGEPSSGHWSTRDLPAPRNIKRWKLSKRSPSQRYDPAPLNIQQATVLDTLCQTISKTGAQPHPLAEKLPKIIIRSQTPQNTPPDAVLPTRNTRSSLILQNIGTSTLHQEAYTTHWTNLTHWRQTSKKTQELRTCSLWKGDPKHSKVSNMRRQRNTQQMKEQGKNPPDLTNEEKIGSPLEKEFRVMIVKMI